MKTTKDNSFLSLSLSRQSFVLFLGLCISQQWAILAMSINKLQSEKGMQADDLWYLYCYQSCELALVCKLYANKIKA